MPHLDRFPKKVLVRIDPFRQQGLRLLCLESHLKCAPLFVKLLDEAIARRLRHPRRGRH